MTEAPFQLLLGIASLGITAYFWLVQARCERPQLTMYQVERISCGLSPGSATR